MERAANADEQAIFKAADKEAGDLNRRLQPITTRTEELAARGAKFPARSKN